MALQCRLRCMAMLDWVIVPLRSDGKMPIKKQEDDQSY
jgi:hypothetical protein